MTAHGLLMLLFMVMPAFFEATLMLLLLQIGRYT